MIWAEMDKYEPLMESQSTQVAQLRGNCTPTSGYLCGSGLRQPQPEKKVRRRRHCTTPVSSDSPAKSERKVPRRRPDEPLPNICFCLFDWVCMTGEDKEEETKARKKKKNQRIVIIGIIQGGWAQPGGVSALGESLCHPQRETLCAISHVNSDPAQNN